MIELTVICINKNSEKYIEQTLKSILSQDFLNFKILILDSNSSDRSIEIVKKLNSQKIEVINLNENVNHHTAFLTGIELTKSKFITFMTTTDGYVDNEWFKKGISKLNDDDKLSFVFANSIARDINGNLTSVNQRFFQTFELPSHEYFLPFYLATKYHINELNCIWNTKVVKSVLKKNPEITKSIFDPIVNDLFEFLEFEAISEGFMGKYINTVANYGRIHEDSLTKKIETHYFSKLKKREEILKKKKLLLFKKIKNNNYTFIDKNLKKISSINNIKSYNFYIMYFYYKFFYPPFKTSKPFYSLFYIFDKIYSLIFKKLLLFVFNIFPKFLKKNFFK